MSSPYSATLLEHYRRPRNFGSLPHPDAMHEVLNPLCGDRIRLELAIADGAIRAAAFRGDACAICTAATSLLTERLSGMPLATAESLRPGDVLPLLQAPIPDARLRCALLPLEALHGALRQHASPSDDPPRG